MQKPSTPPDIGNSDRSSGILATALLALVIVIIFITLRFVTRIWLVKRVGWDDWCIVFAGVSPLIYEKCDGIEDNSNRRSLGKSSIWVWSPHELITDLEDQPTT